MRQLRPRRVLERGPVRGLDQGADGPKLNVGDEAELREAGI